MTDQQLRGSVPTSESRRPDGARRLLSILSALGWRYGLLWWAPFALFLLVAGYVRLTLNAEDWTITPGYFEHSSTAATWYLAATCVQVVLLWLRTPYAISLGHRRGPVFAVMTVVTIAIFVVQAYVGGAVTLLEALALGGDQGVLVTSAGGGKGAEPGLPPVPGFGAILTIIYGPMIAAILASTTILARRWGIAGGLAGLLASSLAMFGWLGVWAAIALPDQLTIIGPALLVLGCWFAFRRQPV